MDHLRSGRTLTALSLIVLAILAGAAPADGARNGRAPASTCTPTRARILDLAGSARIWQLLIAGALLADRPRPRWPPGSPRGAGPARARAGARSRSALSLVLTVFAVETAVHSVHHLARPEAGADCSVLSSSQSLAWGAADPVVADTPTLDVTTAPPARSRPPRGGSSTVPARDGLLPPDRPSATPSLSSPTDRATPGTRPGAGGIPMSIRRFAIFLLAVSLVAASTHAACGPRADRPALLPGDARHRRSVRGRRAVAADGLPHPQPGLRREPARAPDRPERRALEAAQPEPRPLARRRLHDPRSRSRGSRAPASTTWRCR